jgi:hypothetical protein
VTLRRPRTPRRSVKGAAPLSLRPLRDLAPRHRRASLVRGAAGFWREPVEARVDGGPRPHRRHLALRQSGPAGQPGAAALLEAEFSLRPRRDGLRRAEHGTHGMVLSRARAGRGRAGRRDADRRPPDWPLQRLIGVLYKHVDDAEALEAMAGMPELAEDWRVIARRRLAMRRTETGLAGSTGRPPDPGRPNQTH